MSRTLAEAQADLRAARERPGVVVADPSHAVACSHEPRCWTKTELDADLARRRHEITRWFGPGPGQQTLWEAS